MVVPVLDLLMHKLTFLKEIIVIPVIQTMVTMQTMTIDFLTLAEVVVAMEATMEKGNAGRGDSCGRSRLPNV